MYRMSNSRENHEHVIDAGLSLDEAEDEIDWELEGIVNKYCETIVFRILHPDGTAEERVFKISAKYDLVSVRPA